MWRVACFSLVLLFSRVSSQTSIPVWGEVTGSWTRGNGYSYVYVNNSVQLNCTVNKTVSWNAEDLQFTLENDICDEDDSNCTLPGEPRVISNRTLQLNAVIRGEQDAGEYFCWIRAAQRYLLVNSHKVVVQYRPQRVTDEGCQVYNWDESLTCRWKYGLNYINNSYNNDLRDMSIVVAVVNRGSYTVCPQPVSLYGETAQCVWAGDNFRAAAQYFLNITITNDLTQDKSSTFFPILTSNIVRPAGVSEFSVESKNSTCVALAWNHERQYREKFFRVNVSDGQQLVTENMNAVLCGFQPYTQYTFSVECHPGEVGEPQGFWSESVQMIVTTDQSVPSSSFGVLSGSYKLGSCRNGGKRNITVFMKEVPPSQRNGKIIGYRLMYNTSNSTTVDVDAANPTSVLVRNVDCDANFWLRIFARTVAGPSQSNARLHIVSEDGEPVSAFAVKVLPGEVRAVWNAAHVDGLTSAEADLPAPGDVQYGATDRIHDAPVTVFWCLRDKRILEKMCKGEIQGVTAPFRDGEVVIPLQKDDVPRDFLFGVSTSGREIQWTDCRFRRESPIEAPKVTVDQVDEELEVLWFVEQCSDSYPVHTTGVVINVCQHQRCQDPTTVDGTEVSHHRVQCPVGSPCNITVQAVDYFGRKGPPSEPIVQALQAPPDTDSMTTAIIGSLCGVLLLVISCYAAWYCKNKFKEKEAKFVDLELPVPTGIQSSEVSDLRGNYRDIPTCPCHASSDVFSNPAASTKETELSMSSETENLWEQPTALPTGMEDTSPQPSQQQPIVQPLESSGCEQEKMNTQCTGQDAGDSRAVTTLQTAAANGYLSHEAIGGMSSAGGTAGKPDCVTCLAGAPSVLGNQSTANSSSINRNQAELGGCVARPDASWPGAGDPQPGEPSAAVQDMPGDSHPVTPAEAAVGQVFPNSLYDRGQNNDDSSTSPYVRGFV